MSRMCTYGRAQAATEYLIILAAVLIVAVLLVSLLGEMTGVPMQRRKTGEIAGRMHQDLAMTDIAVTDAAAYLTLINRMEVPINVTSITINGSSIASSVLPLVLVPYEESIFNVSSLRGTTGEYYAWDVVLWYTEILSGKKGRSVYTDVTGVVQ
ncbi:MAG: hypothetical protein ACOCWQ_02160 [Nanoarchaeota archaeon]